MWIKSSGQLSDNVFQLTTAVSSHFLVWGDVGALVDTSIAAVHPRLIEELSKYFPEGEGLRYICLSHAHFDHIGGLPYLRRFAPEAEVIAGPACAELLAQADFRASCFQKNVRCAEAMKVTLDISEEEWNSALTIDRILGDGDTLMLGDEVELKLIACPGHTTDSVAYYVLPDAALTSGEALGGYNGRERISCCFLSSYKDYLASLGKLSGLEVKVLGFPHSGALTGEIATKYFVDARREAERFYTSVKERLDQGELIDEIYASQLPEWVSQSICPEGPFVEEQASVLKSMIKAVAEQQS